VKIHIEKRGRSDLRLTLVSKILAIVLSLPIVSIFFIAYGANPAGAITEIFTGAFGSVFGFSQTIVKAIPLILCGVGLTVAYKAGVMNIGAEGQLIAGAIAATWVALFSGSPSLLTLPLMLIVGAAAGAAFAVLPGLMRAKLGVNEIIVTLMLNYVAQSLLVYLVTGPWKGTTSRGYPQTDPFPDYAILSMIPGTRIPYVTLSLALGAAIACYVLLFKTKIGYEMRVLGDNLEAARFAGMNITYMAVAVMAISGGLAGLAGVGEAAGTQARLVRGISPGYGFTAIIPAWLSSLDPLFVLPSSILVGGLFVGGDIIQITLRLPFGVVNAFNGTILVLLASSEFLVRYRLVIER